MRRCAFSRMAGAPGPKDTSPSWKTKTSAASRWRHPAFARAQAEVDLLAVAAPEGLLVEGPGRLQAGPRDVHAEAHGGRNARPDRPALARANTAIQPGRGGAAGQGVGLREARVARDRRVVGEGRDRAGLRLPGGAGREAVQPVAGHLGVAVEEHHVPIGVQAHALVAPTPRSRRWRVGDEGDAPLAGEVAGATPRAPAPGSRRRSRRPRAGRATGAARTLSRQRRVWASPR